MESTPWEALRVSIYQLDDRADDTVPQVDGVWRSGVVTILIQLVLSIVPCLVYREWHVFLITAAGTILALATSSLPQWRDEKWACPKTGGPTVAITTGNGSRHVIIVENDRKNDKGLHLELLAHGTRVFRPSLLTKISCVAFATLWICLLITMAGIEDNTWYLLAIGAIGSAQNLYAAAAIRSPAAHGIHVKLKETIVDSKVAPVLKRVEQRYPSLGLSLVEIFFPASLRVKDPEDLEFWRGAMERRLAENKHGIRLDRIGEVSAGQPEVASRDAVQGV